MTLQHPPHADALYLLNAPPTRTGVRAMLRFAKMLMQHREQLPRNTTPAAELPRAVGMGEGEWRRDVTIQASPEY